MFVRPCVSLLTIFLCTHPALASQESHFKKALSDIDKSGAMVGLAVAVVRDGEVSFTQTYGVKEAGGVDRITPETTFRIASLSKAFAATVAVQLEHERKLSLNDLAISSNRGFQLKNQAQAESATLSHVLSHRLSLPPYAYDNLLEAGAAPERILGEMKKVEPICNVGSCYAYQNVGFNMIAQAIEGAEKQAYAASVAKRLFKPLGMSGASFGKQNLMADEDWARSYKRKRGEQWKVVKVKQAYYDVPAAGGVNANIVDMGKWLAAQLGNAPEVLSASMLNRLHSPQVKTTSELRRMKHMRRVSHADYGLGWRIYQYGGNTVVNHSGSVEGYAAQIAFLPEKNIGIVLLTNSNSKAFWQILPKFLDQELGLSKP